MKKLILTSLALGALRICAAQEYKIAIVGLVHSHVWGHLNTILKSKDVKLVGSPNPIPCSSPKPRKPAWTKACSPPRTTLR